MRGTKSHTPTVVSTPSEMRLLNVESVRRCGADLSADVLPYLESTTRAVPAPVVIRRILNGRWDDVSNALHFSKVLGVSLQSIRHELIRYSWHNLPTECQLPEDHAILQSLPVEQLTQLEIPIVAVQESDVCDIDGARCTGTLDSRNHWSRNDWVWVQAGSKGRYGALRGCLPAKLVALFKIMDYTCENALRSITPVRLSIAVHSGFTTDIHGLVKVQMRDNAREFTIVDVRKIYGLAQGIPEGERRWRVNSRIDLRTFNELY